MGSTRGIERRCQLARAQWRVTRAGRTSPSRAVQHGTVGPSGPRMGIAHTSAGADAPEGDAGMLFPGEGASGEIASRDRVIGCGYSNGCLISADVSSCICTRNHGENGTTGAVPDGYAGFSAVGLVEDWRRRLRMVDRVRECDCQWNHAVSSERRMLGTRRRRLLQADSRPYSERGGVGRGTARGLRVSLGVQASDGPVDGRPVSGRDVVQGSGAEGGRSCEQGTWGCD